MNHFRMIQSLYKMTTLITPVDIHPSMVIQDTPNLIQRKTSDILSKYFIRSS